MTNDIKPQYNREYLVWNKDKRERENQYLIVTCLFDMKELSTAIVRSLYQYLAGSNNKTVKKHLSLLDKMMIKRYWSTYIQDADKTQYKDWLDIDSKFLMPLRNRLEYSKGMPYKDYQKYYREKKKQEKKARLCGL